MKTVKRLEDEENEGMSGMVPSVFVNSYSANMFNVYLDGPIREPWRYRELYQVFLNASNRDVIRLHINSPGGQLDAGIQIINHMNDCEAEIVGVIHQECASMASCIAMNCDNWELNKFSTMMVHSCSFGAGGKQSDVLTRVQHIADFNREWILDTYTGFLSESDIQKVLCGEDIYLSMFDHKDGRKLDTQLEKLMEYRKAKKEEEENPKPQKPQKPQKAKPIKKATVKAGEVKNG